MPMIYMQNYSRTYSDTLDPGYSFDRSDYYFSGYSKIFDGSEVNLLESYTGTISLSLPLSDGERGHFYAFISTNVEAKSTAAGTVPEPEGILLFSIGLIGLVGLRKRIIK